MGFLFPKSWSASAPALAPAPLPAVPESAVKPVAVKAKAATGGLVADEAKRRRGRASTILTGPLGLIDEPLLGRKTLLGG